MIRSLIAAVAVVTALTAAVLAPSAASASTDPATDQRPVAISQTVSTPQDTPIAITMQATDADGDALTYSYLDFSGCHCHVTNGTVAGDPPDVVFTPAAGFQGTAQIFFQASDGTLSSNTGPQSSWGIITIDVTAPVVTPPPAKPTKLSQCLRGGWKTYGYRSELWCLLDTARRLHR